MKNYSIIESPIKFLHWLLKKNKYICPKCNSPIEKQDASCGNCGQPLGWRKYKQ